MTNGGGPDNTGDLDVSIIIVNYNTRDRLLGCLKSIVRNTNDIAYEVIVVDNGSDDGSVEAVRSAYPDVPVLANGCNAGFSRANNLGAGIARGRYLLFLNSDTEVLPGAVYRMRRFFEDRPDAGAVGGKLLNSDGTLQLSCGPQPSLGLEIWKRTLLSQMFPRSKVFGRVKYGDWDYDRIREVGWVSGACMMVPRDLMRLLGGFDEQIFMYYEDVDLCTRIRQAGRKVYFNPEIQVVHHGAGSASPSVRRHMIVSNFEATAYFFQKHYGMFSVLSIRLMLALESLLRSGIWLLFWIAGSRRAGDEGIRVKTYLMVFVRSLFDWRKNWVGLR